MENNKYYCKNCGGELTEKSINGFCTRCGYLNEIESEEDQGFSNDTSKVNEIIDKKKKEIESNYKDEITSASNMWYVFGFIFFPVAIIIYLYFRKLNKYASSKMIKGAFIGIIFYSVFITVSYKYMDIYYDYNYELGAISGKIDDMTKAVANDYKNNSYKEDKKYSLNEIESIMGFDIKSDTLDVYFKDSSYIYVTYGDIPTYYLCFVDTEGRGLNKVRYNGVYPEKISSNLKSGICE